MDDYDVVDNCSSTTSYQNWWVLTKHQNNIFFIINDSRLLVKDRHCFIGFYQFACLYVCILIHCWHRVTNIDNFCWVDISYKFSELLTFYCVMIKDDYLISCDSIGHVLCLYVIPCDYVNHAFLYIVSCDCTTHVLCLYVVSCDYISHAFVYT